MPRIEIALALPEGENADRKLNAILALLDLPDDRVSGEVIPDAKRTRLGFACPGCGNASPTQWILVEYKACVSEIHRSMMSQPTKRIVADDDYIDNPDSGRSERLECSSCGQAFVIPTELEIDRAPAPQPKELSYAKDE